MKKLIAILMILLTALTLCVSAAAETEARKMETPADADAFIAAFLGANPEALEGAWALTPQMEAALAQLGGMAGLAKQLAALGTPESVLQAYEGEIGGMKVFYIPCVFSAAPVDLILAVQDGAIAGLQTGPYTGRAEQTGSALFDSVELPLPVPALGELPGILTIPKGEGPFPAVILLHGSGPSDMDETVGSLKPFRDIAEGLAERGIAVYRFDKRTYAYGAMLAADKQATPENEYLEDAVNAVQMIAAQDRIDPARVYVLGHSLGGNMIPAVARALKDAPVRAKGFIMMAASPRPLDALMREQVDFLYSLMPEITEEMQAERDALFADLDRLRDPDALTEDDMVAGAYAAYWKWLADYDILRAAAEITEPVLVMQGEEDYQVTTEDLRIWKDALGDKENWRFISYPGLTHAFTPGLKAEGSAVYARADSVDEQVIRDLADFIAQ